MIENIVSFEDVSKAYGDKSLFAPATFGINRGEKIGLIGINGCGKTSFLNLLAGKDSPDGGRIVFRGGIRLSYLTQQPMLDDKLSLYEFLYYGDHPKFALLREHHRLSERMAHQANPDPADLRRHQELLDALDRESAWGVEREAHRVLSMMGFEDFGKRIANLSGGEKRRLDLARVLLEEPDLLLLDEPTNHLDIEVIDWLQETLSNSRATIIFVTHDRYFLDAVSTRILELEKGKLRFYEGNYSRYLKQKELEIVDLERKETRRLAQLQKEMKWLQRGARARASKPKDHVERVKALIDKSYLTSEKELDISFRTQRLGKTILEARNVTKRYDKILFERFTHVFQKMERIGIIGPNGCGKTTLLRVMAAEEDPEEGSVKVGVNTKVAVFRQDAGEFPSPMSVIDYIRREADHIRTADGELHHVSEMLERFLFDQRMQQMKLGGLSGGEKKRLYLLKSLMFGCNFLILDEPTNDLDIRTLEVLEDYLDAFKGCLVVVSHDRYFLDRVVDDLFVFEGDHIRKFPGNCSDYLFVRRYEREEAAQAPAEKKSEKPRSVPNKLSYMQTRELEQLETEIARLESRQIELAGKIDIEAASLSAADFTAISKEQAEIELTINALLEKWSVLENLRASKE
jgi:ABC transport system ATP-binding/permease protein